MNIPTSLRRTFITAALLMVMAASSLFPASTPRVHASEFKAVAIGDSVMLGAKSQLQKIGVGKVDAKVSRQASSGPALVKKLAANPDIKFVVVHLGTNGSYSVDTCRDTVKAAGMGRTVLLINLKVPRKWENVNNSLMKKCAEGFSASRVQVLDWNKISQSKKSYLYSDGIHLTPAGAQRFARMVAAAIKQTITWEERVTPGAR